MGQEEQERIIIPDESGTEHEFNVLYKFDVEDMDSAYVALVPVEQENAEEQDLYVFRIEETDDDLKLFQIEDDEEWDIIEETIATLEEDGII